MTPAARLQAAIELLDTVLLEARTDGLPADVLVKQYFRDRRYAGSKDRAAVRELLFAMLRTRAVDPPGISARQAAVCWATLQAPDQLAHFGSAGHAPAAITDTEQLDCQPMPEPPFVAAYGDSLLRAPLDLRVDIHQIARHQAQAALLKAGIACAPTPFAVTGLRCAADAPVDHTALYQDGLIDVQDEGSQLVVALANPQPGETVIDLCAGAGGKTLALAAAMRGTGILIAHDRDRTRLDRLTPRAVRAGCDRWIVQRTDPLADLHGTADLVVIDAPCTGSGTWRRNPEARLRPRTARLAHLVPVQRKLLAQAAQLLRAGGRIVYAVCSIYPEEGEDHMATLPAGLVVEPWAQAWPAAAPGLATASTNPACLKLTPKIHQCDGFFIVCLRKA